MRGPIGDEDEVGAGHDDRHGPGREVATFLAGPGRKGIPGRIRQAAVSAHPCRPAHLRLLAPRQAETVLERNRTLTSGHGASSD